MSWLTRLNPFSRLKGERDVIALIYLKCFIPRLELEFYRNNFLLTEEFFVTRVGLDCLGSITEDVLAPVWPHLSKTQQYNNSKNADAVARGLSAEVENLLMTGQLFVPDSTVVSIEKLSISLDRILQDVGVSAVKSAQSGAVAMSADSVLALFEDAITDVKKHRQKIRNPFGIFNSL